MKQNKRSALNVVLIPSVVLVFGVACFLETNAWARAGGGGSSGSRGGRSYSAPSRPSSPSPGRPSSPGPGYSAPGYGVPGSAGAPPSSGGWFGRSPFLQGMAGGLAGGFLGNMLFGGHGYAGSGGGYGGYGGYPGGGYGGRGGIGLMDIIVLGVIGYFIYRWWSRRRRAQTAGTFYSTSGDVYRMDEPPVPPMSPYYGSGQQNALPEYDEVQAGFQQLRQYDSTLDEESFIETAQDLFFRIQAGWMNRSLAGIENLFTPEMSRFFNDEFNGMKQKGTINRLENIAVRKVQPSEIWQEAGKDYITVLFTANLLDYTVDDKTGNVVAGDKMNPIKFEEFWTFTRDTGSRQWQLSAINQVGQPLPRYN